jgi:hypothetical protein
MFKLLNEWGWLASEIKPEPEPEPEPEPPMPEPQLVGGIHKFKEED